MDTDIIADLLSNYDIKQDITPRAALTARDERPRRAMSRTGGRLLEESDSGQLMSIGI
jgi:hypothetical protein